MCTLVHVIQRFERLCIYDVHPVHSWVKQGWHMAVKIGFKPPLGMYYKRAGYSP